MRVCIMRRRPRPAGSCCNRAKTSGTLGRAAYGRPGIVGEGLTSNAEAGLPAATNRKGTGSLHRFRMPLGTRLFSLFGTILIGAASLVIVGVAVVTLFMKQWLIGAGIAVVAALMVELTRYVLRDLQGKWGLRIVFNPETVELDLPANRSLIHRPPGRRLSIAYRDIASIETRLEAYASFGTANMQRAYVLRLNSGERVYLFEERALGTSLQSNYFTRAVEEIAARAQAPVEDLGMARGDNGVLGVWGTKPADWASPALSSGEQRRMWGTAVRTGQVAFLLVALALTARGVAALLR